MSFDFYEPYVLDAKKRLNFYKLAHVKGVVGAGAGKSIECPGCKKKKFEIRGSHPKMYFTCWRTSCDWNQENVKAAGGHVDEIGFISRIEGLERKEAMLHYFELAHVTVEEPPKKKTSKKKSPNKKQKKQAAKKKKAEKKAAAKKSSKIVSITEGMDEEDQIPGLAGDGGSTAPPLRDEGDIQESGGGGGAWHYLWQRMKLEENHRRDLTTRRVITPERVEELGLRSTGTYVRDLVEEMRSRFSEEVLLGEGILTVRKGEEAKVNSQLRGWGVIEEDWTFPIAIPYFDEKGHCIYIRPHKGGCFDSRERAVRARKRHAARGGYAYTLDRPKGGGPAGKNSIGVGIVTEGEFCALAPNACGYASASLPGTGFGKDPHILGDLREWRRRNEIHTLVVAYDNDDRSDKPWDKRWDIDVWARVLAHYLGGSGSQKILVAQLPEEWRDEKGSADWDGHLFDLFKSNGTDHKRAYKEAAPEVAAVIEAAHPAQDPGDLFSWKERRFISHKFEQLTRQRRVPIGGQDEEEAAQYFYSHCHPAYREKLEVESLCEMLRASVGCYIKYAPASKERRSWLEGIKKEIWEQARPEAETASLQCTTKIVNWLMDKGVPVLQTNFHLRCHAALRLKADETGRNHYEKLMTLVTTRGEEIEVQVPPSALASTTKAREFFASIWKDAHAAFTGQREFDMAIDDAYRFGDPQELVQVDAIGQLADTPGAYLFGDCLISDGGKVNLPDDSGIVHHEGVGYLTDRSALHHINQGLPLILTGGTGLTVEEGVEAARAPDEGAQVAEIFSEILNDFAHCYGGNTGLLAIGQTLAYGFSEEMLARFRYFPGLYMYGKKGGGKTTKARWLLNIWGWPEPQDLAMSSAAGLYRLLTQHSNIPLWVDEAQEEKMNPALIDALKNAYNRQVRVIGSPDSSNRTRGHSATTTPIVTGETIANNAALQSRYVQVIIHPDRRQGDDAAQAARYEKMVGDSADYYRIGRFLMMHRSEFAEEGIRILMEKAADPEAIRLVPDPRSRMVYLTPYAGLCAFAKITGHSFFDEAQVLEDFLTHAQGIAKEIRQTDFLTAFWNDIVSLARRESKARKFILPVRAELADNGKPTILKSWNGSDGRRLAIINGKDIFPLYLKDLSQQKRECPLNKSSLRAQLASEPYWIKRTTRPNAHQIAHENWGKRHLSCWLIDLDEMGELGDEIAALRDEDQAPPNDPDGQEPERFKIK